MSYQQEIDDRFYYNVTIRSTDINNPYKIAKFREQLDQPIINNPEDYYLAVVRYRVPTQTIPIFSAQIQPFPNVNPNLTIYSVTLSLGANNSRVYVTFVPSQKAPQIIIPGPATAQNPNYDITNLYYYVHSYQHFIDMINKALVDALTALPGVPVGQLPPYFQFDEVTGKIALVAQKQYYDYNTPGTTEIYINQALYPFLRGFNDEWINSTSAIGKDIRLVVENTRNNTYQPSDVLTPAGVPTTALPEYYIMYQEYNQLADWNSFVGLSLESNLLPCRTEFIPAAVDGDSSLLNGEPVISDIEPFIQFGTEARTNVQFFQEGPYRLINMYGNAPVSKIDVNLYWTDIFGNVSPLFLSFNKAITIKLAFIKKSTFTS